MKEFKWERQLEEYYSLREQVIQKHKKGEGELRLRARTMDEWLDFLAKAQKKTLPLSTGLGKAFFKLAKTVSPGGTFKQVTNEAAYDEQKWLPLSSIEVSYVSDREAILKIKNCPLTEAYAELLKKTGLDITPKYICENDLKFIPKVFKEFGVDLTSTIEENGCQTTIKLK